MTILGIDVWEGNLVIDEPMLVAEQVRYFIVRLNSITGGHHMDENFPEQWEQAAPYIRWPYFVYNPWATGMQNFDWLAEHMPQDARAVSVDVEVRKDGYSPHHYATQFNIFRAQLPANWHYNVYTGAWFLDCLDNWPADADYWWARYPGVLYPDQRTPITWEELRTRMAGFGWHPTAPGTHIPGPCKLWQCTADRYILPGCGGTCVDINQWNGTMDELEAFAGEAVAPPPTLEERVTAIEDWIAQHQP